MYTVIEMKFVGGWSVTSGQSSRAAAADQSQFRAEKKLQKEQLEFRRLRLLTEKGSIFPLTKHATL